MNQQKMSFRYKVLKNFLQLTSLPKAVGGGGVYAPDGGAVPAAGRLLPAGWARSRGRWG